MSVVGRTLTTRSLTCSDIEHLSEYASNIGATDGAQKGSNVTIIDERELVVHLPVRNPVRRSPVRPVGPRVGRAAVRRPTPARPAVAPLRYRGNGVAVSSAPHRPRPVSTKVAIALAGLAGLITLWLGSLAHLSSASPAPARVPEQLAVVRVQAGDTLQRLAERVAPETPVRDVMRRITDLNELGSASLEAGQTLIAPIG